MKYIMKIKKCLSCSKNLPKLLLCGLVLVGIIFLLTPYISPLINKLMGREGFGPANELMLVHMTGCGHCKNMMPEWKKFVSNNKTGIKTTTIERGENPSLVKKHNITGFPSILLLDSAGNKIKDYTGPRTSSGFDKFCKSNN